MNLAERLAAKLDIAVADADRLLEQFLQEAQDELQHSGQADLSGVGTFQQTESGDITFTPAPSLEAMVNYRFAGLSTLEVPSPSDARDVPPSGIPESPVEDEAVDMSSDEPNEPETTVPVETERRSTADDEEVEQFWDEQRAESPLGVPPQRGQETSYSVVENEPEDQEQSDDLIPDEPIPHEEEATEPEPTGSVDSQPEEATFPRRPRSSDNNVQRKLGIVAVLLITSGLVLLMYFALFRGPSPSSTAETTEETATAPAPSADDNGGNSESQEASSPSSVTSADESSESGAAEESNPFDAPLRSADSIQPEHGGYTWIVASLADRTTAEELRDTYAQNGFRTAIFEGGSGYRVAVGQFETTDNVLATRGELPENVASAAWVLKIESNMSPLVSS